MESDNEEDGSDGENDDSSGDGEGNNIGKHKVDDGDFLIRERPAPTAPESAEKEKDDNHASEQDQEKTGEAPTIELKISLGDFGGPVMDLLGASDAPNPDLEASGEDEQNDNSQASERETGVSNLLLNGKRKHEAIKEKPKGPLITELS